jgi:hypothetical protein
MPLARRLAALEKTAAVGATVYLWADATEGAETVDCMIRRRFPDGVPDDVTVTTYRWACASQVATGTARAGRDG